MGFFDIFKPKWKSSSPSVRAKAVNKLSNQTRLSKIAVFDEEEYVRKAAVRRLTDQKLLAKIARIDKNKEVREAAVTILTSQSVLSEIAKTDESLIVRFGAAKKLRDRSVAQTAFAEIAKKENPRENPLDLPLREALDFLDDQALLAEVAETALDPEARRVAIGKITDQAALAEIAVANENWEERQAAVKRVTDQALLAKIIKSAGKSIAVVKRLTDQALLSEIAQTDEDEEVRCAAVAKLSDQAVLAKVAIEDKSSSVRATAVRGLADESTLAQIAKNDGNLHVRWSAAEKYFDLTKPGAIGGAGQDPLGRTAANHQVVIAVLAEIALVGEDADDSKRAAEKLADLAALTPHPDIELLIALVRYGEKEARRFARADGALDSDYRSYGIAEGFTKEYKDMRWAQEKAEEAALKLGRIGDMRAAKPLLSLLKATAWKKIAEALLQMRQGLPLTVAALVETLFLHADGLFFEEGLRKAWQELELPGHVLDLALASASHRAVSAERGGGHVSVEEGNRAVEDLCAIEGPLSSNILHLVTRMNNRSESFDACEALADYSERRLMAKRELARRGNPPYDASAYRKR